MTLKEIANIAINLGIIYSINLDGGGSTTMVDIHNGGVKLINHPTCLDVIPIKCERRVSTGLCVG